MPVTLRSRTFEGRVAGSHLLITGGVHGDEFEPMEAIRGLIRAFDDESNPLVLIQGSVTLVPVVNEAAFVRGHRMADDEKDLARTCPGSADGTITERTAHALSGLIRDADFYIDLHTGGTELSVYPLTGYVLHPNAEILDKQRAMARAFNLPFIWGTSPELKGRSLSVARDAGVPAIYAEYLGSSVCDPVGVEAYVDGCLNVMAHLGMLDRPQPASRIEHVVEDTRPDSGHMQICNPSPTTGYFQPAVSLGQTVKRGELLGTVCDATGNGQAPMHSSQTGVIVVLRTFPRVRKGETVCVIAETEINS